ncbi:hypothetical protein HU200_045360 [Digitaria exilis]|uniref:DUF1764-domain-containing protein n=1 Tax=Digitaria exilis TaxID=1010633 RepID=A0A835AXZ2_9POAL|nr:hypothetical protein HU200_045360 [Digitaria exilis]
MATKSHKKKKASALNPSINPKAAASDKKPEPPKPIEEQPEQAAAEKKPKKQKARDEIDEIFSAAKADKKRKSAQQEEAEAQGGKRKKPKERTEGGSNKKKSNKTPGSKGKGRVANDDGEEFEKRPRRRTNDGLTIYSAEELGFGKADAGGTPLCPFDCDCCF